MKSNRRRARSGFTLIELSMAMGIGITISALVMGLFNQQLAFLKIFRAQGFLTEEAPIISMYVSRLVGKAERFGLYASRLDAMKAIDGIDGPPPVLTESTVMVMSFRQPDGTFRASILEFEDLGDGRGPALYYYAVPLDGELGVPWALTYQPDKVSFFVIPPDGEPDPRDGVLRMRLTGPNNEQITYAGTMQQ